MNLLRNRTARALWGFVISLPYPGLGHILARRWRMGVLLLAVSAAGGLAFAILGSSATPTPGALKAAGILLALALALALFAAFDAARRLSRREPDIRPPWQRSTWFSAIVVIAISLAAGLAFPRHWRTFSMPSSAMTPTLVVGDYFMADTHPFTPARGDVVLFHKVGDPVTIYAKRIVGLPGETVQMIGGRLHVDRKMVPREPVDKFEIADNYGKARAVPTYRETLPGGAAHDIVEIEGDTGFLDDTPAFPVPAGQYFVIGDNRDNSTDSRLALDKGGVGYVPAATIIGKAGTVYWSNSMSRLLTPIR